MSINALRAISSIPALLDAWNTTYKRASNRSRNISHGSELSLSDFSSRRDFYLKELSYRLRSKTPFSFSPLRAAILPKKDHGYRIICVPTLHDRVVQRSLLSYLTEGDKCGILNPVSFGFIKGQGVKKAAQHACKLRESHPWAYKTDITKFFDRIDRTTLKALIRKRVRQKSILSLLYAAVDCEIGEPVKVRRDKIAAAGIKSGRGVRQGMPLSPLFANLVLRDFDRSVVENDIKMVRYADDLIIFADTIDQCHEIHKFCEVELSKLHLSIPPPGTGSKTQIYKPDDPADFLGVGLVKNGKKYSLRILQPQKTKILQQLNDSLDFNQLMKNGITIGRLNQRIEATIAGYLSSYDFCENVQQLEIALDQTRIEAFTKVFEKGLGIDIRKLTAEQKHFLGL